MDTSPHTIESLFLQLGLDTSGDAVEQFIKKNQLRPNESLMDAKFWTRSQAQFIKESWVDDSDWVEAIDSLDTMLHTKHKQNN